MLDEVLPKVRVGMVLAEVDGGVDIVIMPQHHPQGLSAVAHSI